MSLYLIHSIRYNCNLVAISHKVGKSINERAKFISCFAVSPFLSISKYNIPHFAVRLHYFCFFVRVFENIV